MTIEDIFLFSVYLHLSCVFFIVKLLILVVFSLFRSKSIDSFYVMKKEKIRRNIVVYNLLINIEAKL